MADINNQSFIFTASGLLSAATGPNNTALIKVPAASGGLTDQPTELKKIRIQGIKVLKVGAAGSVEIFDSAAQVSNQPDSIYETNVSDAVTNLGINIKSGDVFVKITGGFKVWLYVDLNK